jgi:hypothetical protein
MEPARDVRQAKAQEHGWRLVGPLTLVRALYAVHEKHDI